MKRRGRLRANGRDEATGWRNQVFGAGFGEGLGMVERSGRDYGCGLSVWAALGASEPQESRLGATAHEEWGHETQ